MQIYFLGTGAAIPSPRRKLPTLAVKIHSEIFLCDCCEGTQQNLAALHLSPRKIHHIFISHLHGDHIFGLPGLLTSQQLLGRESELNIWGPIGIQSYLNCIEKVTEYKIRFPIKIHEFDSPEPPPVDLKQFSFTAKLLLHSIPCYGFRFTEKGKTGKFDEIKAQKLKIPSTSLRAELVKGNPVTLENGRTIQPSELIGPAPARKSVVYCTDTRPCEASLLLAKDAEVLLHDSTFMHSLHDRAKETTHSTSVEAATVARQAHVRRLYLWHISSRNEEADEETMIEESRAIFKESYIPEDLTSWSVT